MNVSLTEEQARHGSGNPEARSPVTIDVLPDVALLIIFDFYLCDSQIEAWRTLVHVCRNWRNLVFESPRRLGLRLLCEAKTPIQKKLDVWPHFPIVVESELEDGMTWGLDNIFAALKYNDRICELDFSQISSLQLEEVLEEMQKPFPELTRLVLESDFGTLPVFPASFLGGIAPSLQTLNFDRIPFPGLPSLLLSATQLVDLTLWRIPHSGYITPEALVTGLSVLNRLEILDLEFESPQSLPDRRSPPQRRILLPVLTKLWFSGFFEYMEDLVSQLDAPLLDDLDIILFYSDTYITSQLTQFVNRTPKYKAPRDVLFRTVRVGEVS